MKIVAYTKAQRTIIGLLWLVLLLVFSLNVHAATIEQANQIFYNYDIDISNIQKSIDMYNQIIKENSSPAILYEAYYRIAMAYLTMGDFANLDHTDALKDYEAGKNAAQKAIELNPNGSDGYFWYAGNMGRIAERENFLKALLILSEFTKYLNKAYELNPKSLFVLESYAEMYYRLPWAFGGSDSKSIEYAQKALKIDPHYTMPLTTLAKVYISEGKYDMARKVLEEVLNFKNPSYRAGWVMYDKPLAQKLLNSIKNEK
jgi:tetratricopeptide (TPR) repeat protein